MCAWIYPPPLALNTFHMRRHSLAGSRVFGSATSPVIADTIRSAGWSITPRAITLGKRTFTGDHLVLIACWFRHEDLTRGVAVYTGIDERDLIDIHTVAEVSRLGTVGA